MSEFFRATPPGLLSDEDAGFLTSNWNAVPEPERFFYAAKINEYQNFRQHYPRPLTPSEQTERRNERVRLGEVFTDFDKATQADGLSTLQFADAEQLPAIKQGLANRAFVQHLSGLEGDALERDYELARDALAKKMFGGTGVADDAAFHAKAKEWVVNENGKEGVQRSLIEAGRRAAAWEGSGLSEGVRPSLRTWQESQAGKPGYEMDFSGEYERTFKAAQAEAKAEFDRLRPAVDDAWRTLTDSPSDSTDVTESGPIEFDALADRLLVLPAEDRRKVLTMVKARAEMLPEAQKTGFFDKLERSFTRGSERFMGSLLFELPRQLQQLLPYEAQGIVGDGKDTAREKQVIYEDLRRLRTMDIAPNVGDGMIQGGAMIVAESLPMLIGGMAMGLTGGGLVSGALLSTATMTPQLVGQAHEDLRRDLMGEGMSEELSSEYAAALAPPAGLLMATIERLTLGWGNSLPGIKQLQAKLLTQLSKSAVRRGLAVGGVIMLEGGEQQLQEALQDSTPFMMSEIARAMGMPAPDVDEWAPAMQTLTDPSAWVASMIFGAIGFGNMPNLEAVNILRERGASDEQIQTVLAAPDATAYREAVLDAVTRPANQPVSPDLNAEQAGQAVDAGVAGVSSITRDADGWWVEHRDGRRTKTDSVAAAQMLVQDLAQVNTQDEADAMVELADNWAATDPRARQTFTGEQVTAGPAGVFASRVGETPRLVPMDAGSAAELDAELELLARAEGGDAAVTRIVAGSNSLEYRRGIANEARTVVERLNTKQNVGGDVLTLVHERVEATWRAALETGTINMAETFRAIRRLEDALGRAILSEDPSEAEVREKVSELVSADVLGRRKDGTRVPAGAISKGLTAAINSSVDPQERAALGKFRAFLRAVRAFWRNVFKMAAAIGKARRDGKLKDGDEWSAFVDKLMGIDAQKAHEADVARAVGAEVETSKETFAVQVNVAPVRVDSLAEMNAKEMAKRASSAKTIHLRSIINDTAAAYGVPIQQMEPVIGGWTEDGRVSLEVPQAVVFDTNDFDLAQEMAAIVAVSAPDLQNGAFVWEPDPKGPGVMLRFKAKKPEEVARSLQEGGVQGFSYDPATREFSIAFFDKTDTVALENFDEFIRSQQATGAIPKRGRGDQAGGGITQTAGKFGLPSEREYGAYIEAARRRVDQSTGEQKDRLDYVVSRAERRFQRYLAAKQVGAQASAKLATTRRPASAAAAIEQELKGRQFDNIRELGLWIDKRFERKYGVPRFGVFKIARGKNTFSGFTEQEIKQAGEALAYDVLDGLSTDGSGMGWYDERVAETLREFVRLYPELGSNPMEFAVFIGILASTSQGFTVVQNFKHADAVWARYKKDGRLPQDMLFAKATEPINSNFRQMQELIDEFGLHGFAEFMDMEVTGLALRDLYGMQPTGVTQAEVVRGNRVLGPKIGSFFNNLRGRFDTITMDLWYTRTMHRYVGETVVPLDDPRTQELLERFRTEFAKSPRTYGLKAEEFTSDEATVRAALTVFTRWSRGKNEYTEKGYTKFPDGYKIEKAARGIFASAGMKGAPKNKAYRTAFAHIVKAGKEKLKKMGFDLSEADIQAIVWYREKNLFARTGVANASAKPADYVDAVMVLREAKAGGATTIDESAEEEALAEQEEADAGALDETTTSSDTFSLGRAVTPAQDAEYVKAVEAGDMETAQRMVDAAAKKAGFNRAGWHFTDNIFNVFKPSKSGKLGPGIYWSEGPRQKFGSIAMRIFVKMQNPITVDNAPEGALVKMGNFVTGIKTQGVDITGFDGASLGPSENVVFDPNQIKSADPVTRDESGAVIPLSQRFNPADERITFSLGRAVPQNLEEVEPSNFRFGDEDDGSLYHVTTKDRVDAIVYEGEGIQPNKPGQFAGAAAQSNSKGRIFLTERSGVAVWIGELENQLVNSRDYDEDQEPIDDISVIRVPRALVKDLQDDTAEFPAKKGRDFYTTEPIPAAPDEDSETFSLSAGQGLERLANQIANRPSTPVEKARIFNRMSAQLAGMARSVNFNDAGADVLKQSEIRQKAKVMRVELAEKYEAEVLAAGAGETLAAADLAKMRGQPFLAWLTDSTKGLRLQSRLMSRTRATREGRYDPDVNGDYDGAAGLPRWVFNGNQMPDQVAQAAFADGVLPDESVETLWQVIGNEIEQVQKWKQRVRDAEGRLMAAKRRAADEARAWETAEIARARSTREATRDADSRRALVIFDQMLMALPAEVRAQVGGFTRVADLKSNDARFKYFASKVVEIDRVLEIHLRNQYLKELREVFIEGRPRMAAGEKDRGKIGVDGHAWLDEAERISKLSAADLEAEEAAVEKRLASPTLTDDTINHYRKLFTFATDEAGARQALEQHEALLNLFGALTHRRDGGTDVRGRMIPGEPIRNAGEIYAALEAAREVVTTGRLDWFAEVIARRERRAGLRAQAITDAGGPGSLDAVEGQAEDRSGIGAKFRNFIESHFSFEGFMSSVFGQDSATHKWADETSLAADLQYRDAMRARERALTGFLRSLYPRSNVRQRQKRLQQLATSREVPNAPAGVPRMSELDAVHFTMLWADEDTASKEWLTKWGLGNDAQAALEAWLSDDAKAIRQWLVREYDAQYELINAVFRRMYGVNLPRVKNYAPRLTDHGGNANEMQLDPLQEGRQLMAGFTKRRRIDIQSPPRQVDALTAYWQNAHAVEYWKAWAEPTSDFRVVFSHYSTHAAVKSRWGNTTSATLNEWLGVLERGGVQNANGQGMIRRWTAAMADYALIGKLGVLAKQMVAGYAAASQIGIPEFLRSVGRIARGEAAITLREMYRSDTVQRRMANLSPEARVATRGRGLTPIEETLDKFLSRVGTDINALDNAHLWLRERPGFFDAFFTTLSAAAAYDTAYQEARAAGMSEPDARQAAQARTDVVIADSAQPGTVRDKSLGELRTGVMGSLLMPFQSANRQALGMTLLAAKQGRTKDALRMAAIHWMATGIVAQTVGNIMRSVFDDDDVEDIWEWEDYARAVVIGPLTGARFLGMAIEAAAPFFGGFERRQAAVPMSEGIRLLRQAVTGDFDFKSLTETMNGVALMVGGRATWAAIAANILKQGTGVADVLTWSPEEADAKQAKKDKATIKEAEAKEPKPEKSEEQKAAEKARRRAREAARAEAIRQGEQQQ